MQTNERAALIATWVYRDAEWEDSAYPQVGGSSSKLATQAIYWRSLVVFLVTSLRNNPDARHALFTNNAHLPKVDSFDLYQFLRRHDVELIELPFTNTVPRSFWGNWRNQYYILDILQHLRSRSEHAFFVFDCDCVFAGSIHPMIAATQEHGVLIYERDFPPGHETNGWTREGLQELFEEMGGVPPAARAHHAGGELLAVHRDHLPRLSDALQDAFRVSLQRHAVGLGHVHTEEHLLSYVFTRLGYPFGTANRFLARIWTSFSYREVPRNWRELVVWHVPAEKKYGLARLFLEATCPDRRLWSAPLGDEFRRLLGAYLGVPRSSIGKVLVDLAARVRERLVPG